MRAVLLAAVLVGCASATPHTRIAFGSCAFQWKEQPIWDAVIATKPDLYLSLGDAIYGDFDGTRVVPVTKESLKAEWDELAARPKFQRLRKSIPIMAVWDNHDYGTHDGGAEFALKETSKQIFLDFFGEPAGSPRRKRAGIYDAKIFGRVQVILLDTRSFKGPYVLKERSGRTGSMGKYAPNPDPSVTLLGAEQWRWLEARLREPAEVRLVASSTQVIPDQKGMDEWGNYPHERRRLLDLLMGANGVLLLSGNVHFAEISGFETLVEFTSSGLTHTNKEYAAAPNRYRVTGPYTEINFGLVEIDWSRRRITLRAVGANGSRAFEHQVSLDSLQPEE